MRLFSNPENRPFKCLPSLNPKFQKFADFHRGMSSNRLRLGQLPDEPNDERNWGGRVDLLPVPTVDKCVHTRTSGLESKGVKLFHLEIVAGSK
jgi:hypothetical protein